MSAGHRRRPLVIGADIIIIIPGGGRNEVALDLLITKIRSELS